MTLRNFGKIEPMEIPENSEPVIPEKLGKSNMKERIIQAGKTADRKVYQTETQTKKQENKYASAAVLTEYHGYGITVLDI
jgi:hypothetical protein